MVNWNEIQIEHCVWQRSDIELYATVLALESYADSGNYKGDGIGYILVNALEVSRDFKKKKNVGLI